MGTGFLTEVMNEISLPLSLAENKNLVSQNKKITPDRFQSLKSSDLLQRLRESRHRQGVWKESLSERFSVHSSSVMASTQTPTKITLFYAIETGLVLFFWFMTLSFTNCATVSFLLPVQNFSFITKFTQWTQFPPYLQQPRFIAFQEFSNYNLA